MSSTASASATASSAHAGLSVGDGSNPAFKIVGVCLAIGSGLFIGTSFVVKKKGLLKATEKYGNQAGEGHAYLKSWLWWTGMIMMILGEVLNFVAYAFTAAVLVTPLGALSVVICAILSHFFLKESLTFFGWIGCTLCIIGATILALNAPEEQSTQTIAEFQTFFVSPGFLTWAGLCIITALVIVFYVAPRWGRKNMMPYITICSLIGGISVSCTQGLGSSIVTSIQGQVKNWFFWFLFVFVVITLLVEINYLNKALELFNTSMVVPVYFCFFSSATLITSFILYRGLKASAIQLITMVLGFFTICLGITLLQMSKVDPKVFKNLDRRSTMMLEAGRHPTEAEEKGDVAALEDPGMDALRGGFGAVGSVIRARSNSRRMSTASNWSQQRGTGWIYSNKDAELSTHGLENLQRYQHNPMPADAKDRVAQLRQNSDLYPPPQSPTGMGPKPSKSHLKFEEADVVHQYGYGRQHDAFHSQQVHRETHTAPQRPVLNSTRSVSSGSVYQTVYEDPDEGPSPLHGTPVRSASPLGLKGAERDEKEPARGHQLYDNPYSPPPKAVGLPRNRTPEPTSAISTRSGLSGLFNFGPNPELVLHENDAHGHGRQASEDDLRRGGAHRGIKDYPYLKHQEQNADIEREERRRLVSARLSEDDIGRQSEDVGRQSEDTEAERYRKSLDYDPTASPPRPPRSQRRLPSPPLLEPAIRRL